MSTLKLLTHRRALVLCPEEDSVTLLMLAFTPGGLAERARRTEPCDPDLATAVERLLGPLTDDRRWRSAPLALAPPASHVYYTSRSAKAAPGPRESTLRELLREFLQATNLDLDDLAVDRIHTVHGKRGIDSAAAIRRSYLDPILRVLEGAGMAPFLVEPAPCALLRRAIRKHRTPRKAASALRVFLDTDRGLAVLTSNDTPLAWRSIDLARGEESEAILLAVRQLTNGADRYGAPAAPASLLVHGRPDLRRILETPEWMQLSMRIRWQDDIGLNPGEVGRGLALACDYDVEALNLARDLRPRRPILNAFPLGQAALQVALIAGTTYYLDGRLSGLREELRVVHEENLRYDWIQGMSNKELRDQEQALLQRVQTVGSFLETRLPWTDCLADVAEGLPPNLRLSAMRGQDQYADGKPNQTLGLNVEIPIPEGVVPSEVDGLGESLGRGPTISDRLPVIEVGPIQWGESARDTEIPRTEFTVVCRSKS